MTDLRQKIEAPSVAEVKVARHSARSCGES